MIGLPKLGWPRFRRHGVYAACIFFELLGAHVSEHRVTTLFIVQRWPRKTRRSICARGAPLIWEHVNPYDRFELGMQARLAYA